MEDTWKNLFQTLDIVQSFWVSEIILKKLTLPTVLFTPSWHVL